MTCSPKVPYSEHVKHIINAVIGKASQKRVTIKYKREE